MKKISITLLTIILTISSNYGSDKSTDINKILTELNDPDFN